MKLICALIALIVSPAAFTQPASSINYFVKNGKTIYYTCIISYSSTKIVIYSSDANKVASNTNAKVQCPTTASETASLEWATLDRSPAIVTGSPWNPKI
jgi:hypothetical protein